MHRSRRLINRRNAADTSPGMRPADSTPCQKTPSRVHKPAANEPNCGLNAGRFSALSIFAEWGLKRANTRRGAFRV